MNKENILKLRNWHEVNPSGFTMSHFRSNEKKTGLLFYSKESCGTSGCALGWAPFVEGLEHCDEDIDCYDNALSFDKYCLRVFGLVRKDRLWNFLFSVNWSYYFNTQKDFVERCDFALNNTRYVMRVWDQTYTTVSNWINRKEKLKKIKSKRPTLY